MASILLENDTELSIKTVVLNIVTGQIKQPHFLSQASRFYSLSIDGEPPQNIIGWTKNDEYEMGCLFQKKTDNLCFYFT